VLVVLLRCALIDKQLLLNS